MSDSWGPPWSNHPNAPQIPSFAYVSEKDTFAGILLGAISYGIVIFLFVKCMGVLFSPVNSMKRAIKLALVVHTAIMFSFITVPMGMGLDLLFDTFINNREFPGNNEYPPGPFGYSYTTEVDASSIVYESMFPLNQWLADGLLLYRCYVIYSMNNWIMAFPCLMYLATVVMGIAQVYQQSRAVVAATNFNTSYLSICLSLNILLTLMIVLRLILHIWSVRKATGASGGSSELQTAAATVVTMIIESYALYAVALLTFIVSWAVNSPAMYLFKLVGMVQVIAPYLIILRVAKRRALTSESISDAAESMRFRSQGSTDRDGSLPDGEPVNSTAVNDEAVGEPGARDENAIEEVPL